MNRKTSAAAGATVALALLLPASGDAYQRGTVERVVDGDTVRVTVHGRSESVRFIGIDTPEVYGGVECGGRQASAKLRRLLQPGDRVNLSADSTQDRRDRYGRLLRYVSRSQRDIGLAMVRSGWARPYIYERPFRRGKLRAYYRANRKAQLLNRGVYGACRR